MIEGSSGNKIIFCERHHSTCDKFFSGDAMYEEVSSGQKAQHVYSYPS